MNVKKILLPYFGYDLHPLFEKIQDSLFEEMEEIRLRIGNPIAIYTKNRERTVDAKGQLQEDFHRGYCPQGREIQKTLELMTGYSIYAFEEEIKSGYLTLQGGHRVGLTGRAVMENGKIVTIKNINGLNIRVAHQITHCSDGIMKNLVQPKMSHTMIISPPACGKTTMLRDMIRNISNGMPGLCTGQTVGVVDERSEIGGCFMGIPQNDVGSRTDLLDGCPKALGMVMLLRSMAPKVIAVDEIGRRADMEALQEIVNAGIKIFCTVHGKDIHDVLQKPLLGDLLRLGIFERYVVLKYGTKPGTIEGVYDGQFQKMEINNTKEK